MVEKGTAKISKRYEPAIIPDLWGKYNDVPYYEMETEAGKVKTYDANSAVEFLKSQGYEPSNDPSKIAQMLSEYYPVYWFDFVGLEEEEVDFINWIEVEQLAKQY